MQGLFWAVARAAMLMNSMWKLKKTHRRYRNLHSKKNVKKTPCVLFFVHSKNLQKSTGHCSLQKSPKIHLPFHIFYVSMRSKTLKIDISPGSFFFFFSGEKARCARNYETHSTFGLHINMYTCFRRRYRTKNRRRHRNLFIASAASLLTGEYQKSRKGMPILNVFERFET